MDNYSKKAHSVYRLTYHAVFVTKYRREVMDGEIISFIRGLAGRLMEGYGGRLLELNGEADHLHILFELPPGKAPSVVVCSLKTQISKEVRAKYRERIREKLWKDSFWSDSYFLTTTGGASIETLEAYIQKQGQPKRKYRKR